MHVPVNRNTFFFFCVFFLLFFFTEARAQPPEVVSSHQLDIRIRNIGMTILAAWALGNIFIGAIGRKRWAKDKAYFHEMNLIWNVVNLSIAGAGYYFSNTAGVPDDAAALLSDQVFFQKTLLFNAGLDVGYIAFGFYLTERAKNTSKKPERLKGYGKSIVLQGIFLFIFDVVLHIVHARETAGISDFISYLQF